MNCPGAAARRRSIAGAAASISSVCSIITTASAPRGITPPVAIAVAVPGATVSFGAWPQASTSALSVKPARRRIGRARGVGGAQRKAVDIGAVERRHVDRRRDVVRQHAAERVGERDRFGGKRREIEMLLEARLRLLGRDDFEELLLPRGRAHRIEQRDLGRVRLRRSWERPHLELRAGRKAFALRRHQHPAVGARERLHRPVAGGERLDAVRRAPHRHDFGNADGRDDLARERHRHSGLDAPAPVRRRNSGLADDQKRRERAIEPARQHQHR